MKLTVKYFGLLSEITKCREEVLEFHGTTVIELRKALYKKHTDLKMQNFQLAQDMVLVTNDTTITGVEIALLPPFAGG